MKNKFHLFLVSLVVITTVLGVVGLATASILIPAAEKAKENRKADVSPVIDETAVGEWELKASGLEKIEFIHYKKDFAKPGGAKIPKPPACYKLFTPKVKWTKLPVNYVINPSSPVPEKLLLNESQIKDAIYFSAETWDDATSKELMDGYTVDYAVTYGVQDYKNAITFGDYPTDGVIAVTAVWRNVLTKAIVEFDIMFDTDWTWGDATKNPVVMDLQNIATHELGHGVGLADVYENACSAVTMFGFSDYGEIQKRSLETPDITGLQKLYGY